MPYFLTRSRARKSRAHVQVPSRRSIIGRSRKAHIRINDRSVSKVHASIEPVAGTNKFLLRDLGSRNGCYRDGKRLPQFELAPGDEFRLGELDVTFCEDVLEGDVAALRDGVPERRGPATPAVASAIEKAVLPAGVQGATATLAATAVARPASAQVVAPVERLLLGVFLLLALALAVAYGLLPERDPPAPADGAGDVGATAAEPTGSTDPAGLHATSDGANRSGGTDAEVVVVPVAPTGTPRSSAARPPWMALGRELDAQCGLAGCHATAPAVQFDSAVPEQPGRWERNLLWLRSHGALELDSEGVRLAPLGVHAPHRDGASLVLGETALAAARTLREGSGRLLGPQSEHAPYERLVGIPVERIARVRAAWLLLFGRAPTGAELLESAHRELPDLLREARRLPEHWRERARHHLRGRAGYPAQGGFQLPELVARFASAETWKEWRTALAAAAAEAGEVREPTFAGVAPLIAEDGGDAEFEAWLTRGAVAVAGAPLPRDLALRSAWGALFGAAPEPTADALLWRLAAEQLPGIDVYEQTVLLLAASPRAPVAVPPAHEAGDWVRGLGLALLARELRSETCRDLGERIAQGARAPQHIVQECLFADEYGRGWNPGAGSPSPANGSLAPVRIEVFSDGAVRELLRAPQRIERLWRLLPRALVQIFPSDTAPLSAILERGGAGALEAESVIAAHAALLAGQAGRHDALLADGYLFPALGELAQLVGDPQTRRLERGTREWLRTMLALGARAGASKDGAAGAPAAPSILREGCFRIAGDSWEATMQAPATRALRLTQAVLAEGAGAARKEAGLVVLVSLPDPASEPGAREWEEFFTVLELLLAAEEKRTFDLWFWGRVHEPEHTQAFRVLRGPETQRGWVHQEAQFARDFHPHLRTLAAPKPSAPVGGGEGATPPPDFSGEEHK